MMGGDSRSGEIAGPTWDRNESAVPATFRRQVSRRVSIRVTDGTDRPVFGQPALASNQRRRDNAPARSGDKDAMLLINGPLANIEINLDFDGGICPIPTAVACDRLGCPAAHITFHEYDADGYWVKSYTTLELTS